MGVLSSFYVERIFCGSWQWVAPYRRPRGENQPPSEHLTGPALLSYYALREKDLLHLFQQACWFRDSAHLLESFVSLLERRLDNIVFRMGFAESIPEARRLVSRGHILVNRYPPKNARIHLWPGDVVHYAQRPYDQYSISHHFRERPLPSYLKYLNPSTTDRGMMLSLPNLGHAPFALSKTTTTRSCPHGNS